VEDQQARSGRPWGDRTWLLGLLIVPILAGFLLLDGGVGMMLGAATVGALLIVAARAKHDEPIEVAEPGEGVPEGLLLLALTPIEDPRTASIVAAMADPSREEAGGREMLVVSPARSRRLDRWTDDLDRARFESQRSLAVSLASLAAAGVAATGRVGDGDPLQAAEDILRSFAATEVLVVAGDGESDRQIVELERRLDRPLRRVISAGPG
jgi:hypothetical protein